MEKDDVDVVVIGGGLAGLTAAALVARSGASVTVLEKGRELGGRAATQSRDQVHFNMGPHALYKQGEASRILQELGIPFTGRPPSPGQSVVMLGQQLFRFPVDAWTLLPSRLLSIKEKIQFSGFPAMLERTDARLVDRVPLSNWIRGQFGNGNLSLLVQALFRLSTYAADVETMSAGAAIDQLRLALAGSVWYLDRGWQSLVDGLAQFASSHGAVVQTGVSATSVCTDTDKVTIEIAEGRSLRCQAVILAVAPQAAVKLMSLGKTASLPCWTERASPMRAACLDIALKKLPIPSRRFGLGLDQPLYFSVHSAAAKLGPEGTAVVHVAKYLTPGDDGSIQSHEAELEAYLDRLQPGWQEQVVTKRFLPNMVVTPAIPKSDEGGLAGRPTVTSDEYPRVCLAGDWVGPMGQLADASAASAKAAAERAIAHLRQNTLRKPILSSAS